jgi:hypothetical protein
VKKAAATGGMAKGINIHAGMVLEKAMREDIHNATKQEATTTAKAKIKVYNKLRRNRSSKRVVTIAFSPGEKYPVAYTKAIPVVASNGSTTVATKTALLSCFMEPLQCVF